VRIRIVDIGATLMDSITCWVCELGYIWSARLGANHVRVPIQEEEETGRAQR
jgi:hypothetical protein